MVLVFLNGLGMLDMLLGAQSRLFQDTVGFVEFPSKATD